MIRVFSTFTGVGSVEMALRNIGIEFDQVGISEVDKFAILAYDAIHNNKSSEVCYFSSEDIRKEIKEKNISYNFSSGKLELPRNQNDLTSLYLAHINSNNYGDIRLIDETVLPDFDLFTYSFPCKNISIAGKKEGFEEGSETQSSLLWECNRIIKYKTPKYLLMENVKNLVGKANIDLFNSWIQTLSDIGYNSYWKVLNAKDYGVPQNRERVIMVSILKSCDVGYLFPDKRLLNRNVNSIMEEEVDDSLFYEAHRVNHISFDDIRATSKLTHIGNIDNKTHANSRVYDPNGLSPTLNSMNGGNRQPKFKTERGVRRVSPRECWRLMGFTDLDFELVTRAGLPKSKLYERAGRGIAVPMLEDVLKNLFSLKKKMLKKRRKNVSQFITKPKKMLKKRRKYRCLNS